MTSVEEDDCECLRRVACDVWSSAAEFAASTSRDCGETGGLFGSALLSALSLFHGLSVRARKGPCRTVDEGPEDPLPLLG